MTSEYMKEILRVAVAQICQTIGYNATQSAPLELLQDVLDKFMREFTRDLRRQVEHYNRTEANLDDVTLTLNSINVNISELLDYVNNVEPVPFAVEVPKFPARKNSYLNFLKPGSKEVLTRPVHVHDHLPPMLPPEITQPPDPTLPSTSINGSATTDIKPNTEHFSGHNGSSDLSLGDQNNGGNDPTAGTSASSVLDKTTLQSLFKPTTNFDNSDRPTREVSSVVMTTGGYISPAVEGKMPEAIVPDIIDKLLGLDAPPPPTPPPPPVPTPAPPISRPASRSANSTPAPMGDLLKTEELDKDKNTPTSSSSSNKESKKSLTNKSLDFHSTSKKSTNDFSGEMSVKKDRLINPLPMHVANQSGSKPPKFNKKKQLALMQHNAASGMHHSNPNNYANMLLKKAKKQKPPLMPGQPSMDKQKPEKPSKLDPAEKTQRKYMKMLQKMAKQGKVPAELLNNIMISDKKSKILNPQILQILPPGPEKIQLEKLLKKHAKQRQKQIKQQMMQEAQKLKKSSSSMLQQAPPPLVPLFTPTPLLPPPTAQTTMHSPKVAAAAVASVNKMTPLSVDLEEEKPKLLEQKQTSLSMMSPMKSGGFPTNLVQSPKQPQQTLPPPTPAFGEGIMSKSLKSPVIPGDTPVLAAAGDNLTKTPPSTLLPAAALTAADGKELKLSTEPDRSKLNIFKKISKQKTPKSSSPTPLRLPTGMGDAPIINLPSGTTITPTLGPGPVPVPGPSSTVGRNLFPPLATNNDSSNIINLDDIKDSPPSLNVSHHAPPPSATTANTDLTPNRVFGEKPLGGETSSTANAAGNAANADLANKPKKRGRKPGSKNSPKIPGAIPANLLKKNKKMKMDPKLFNPQIPLPPEFASAMGAAGNLSFDNVAQLFGNPINPMEWAQNKQLQQQMLIMAAAKERKELKKKNKMIKQHDLINSDKNMMMPPSNLSMSNVPTSEEVQNINKKLMRMDTILKPAPLPSSSINDLSVDTSLITGKKLPSPSLFPTAPSSTSPLKSPGAAAAASKRLMQGMEAMAAAAAAGLGQPFMLPNRPAFPNLPSNMLSMLPFPFTARPGLIPTPGLFPTPGLGAFQNPKNPLIPGMFPFPNLKHSSGEPSAQDTTEDLSMSKKKTSESLERSYCNVAPLVPEFLKLNTPETSKTSTKSDLSESELPKTPKPRNSHSSMPQEHLLKKMVEAHTPESGSSTKSIPSTPGGMSINTFEQLMKKNDSPIDMVSLSKSSKRPPPMQDTGLDFSMNKKHTPPGLGNMKQAPITLNNEPIEVSDDSDEMSQPPPPASNKMHQSSTITEPAPLTPQTSSTSVITQPTFNMDDMFIANTGGGGLGGSSKLPPVTIESDLSSKELKKLKKQVKKTSASITSSLINPEKSEGVSKLAGGADLIPLSSTGGLAYSSKNIPFNSLTANANPTFNTHNKTTDFQASSNPTTSTPTVYDNVTITAAIPSTTSSSLSSSAATNIFDIQKKRKEHKKIKKELKEGKIKKKKDKKDKSKSKERAEKYLNSLQTSPNKEKIEIAETTPIAASVSSGSLSVTPVPEKTKDKDLIKKLKKEKKKEKMRTVMEETSSTTPTTSSQHHHPTQISPSNHPAEGGGGAEKKHKSSPSSSINSSSSNEQEPPVPAPSATSSSSSAGGVASVVPKLTLKLGSTQSPTPLDDLHKNTNSSNPPATVSQPPVASPPRDTQREPSPELARISPLVTRPPKQKINPGDLTTGSSSNVNSLTATNTGALDSFGDVSKTSSSSSNVNMIVPPPNPWLSGGTISASSVLLPHQLLQTTKHDMTSTATGSSQSTDNSKAHHSSAADRQSPLTLITETSRPSSYIDADGNRVWICPACGKVDDGSPMIGCDGCDAWYHWVCVGIFVAPKDNEDWFCRVCITRKKGLHGGSDKKRKRNKKK